MADDRRAAMARLRQDRSYTKQLEGMAASNKWAREQGFLNIEDYAAQHGIRDFEASEPLDYPNAVRTLRPGGGHGDDRRDDDGRQDGGAS